MNDLYELPPTADIPATKTKKDNPDCQAKCCGVKVLRADTREGEHVVLEVSARRIFTIVWHDPSKPPVASESRTRGYAEHICKKKEA
jgi:hypothetical protein